ncbi:unnamed protein product [Haemonchus placei]|uniref:PH domain-containing protein n=1 Tax=Haemonchus placei TaxID=6290 RepID=A0A0N4X6G7_HAEPC|nr:unnamed protein product [Haemonchus placei]
MSRMIDKYGGDETTKLSPAQKQQKQEALGKFYLRNGKGYYSIRSGLSVMDKPVTQYLQLKSSSRLANSTSATDKSASQSSALPPAPPPAFVGRGHDTAYVTIVTDQPYKPSKANQCISYFPKTKVKKWVNQIVQSSQHYTSGDAVCFYEGSSFVRDETGTTATTTTTASVPIALPPAPPPAFVGRGDDTAYVAIVTDQPYDPSKVNQYMGYFPDTKVKKWANQIVQSSQHYTSGDAVCSSEESSLEREKTATTTTASSPILSPFAAYSPPWDIYNALQPVPPPPFPGRGDDTAYVSLVTNQPYDPTKVKQHMDYFPQTKIQQYANQLGDFSNLGSTNVDGNFAYTFTISRSACEYVEQWVDRIVQSSPYYTSGDAVCSSEESSLGREKTATTTASSSIPIPPELYNFLSNMPVCEEN